MDIADTDIAILIVCHNNKNVANLVNSLRSLSQTCSIYIGFNGAFYENIETCQCYRINSDTKSLALNILLQYAEEEYIIFMDDDVLVVDNLVQSYKEAFNKFRDGYFFGGDFETDVDKKAKYYGYFPRSVTGWEFNQKIYKEPVFLGFNWACKKKDIINAGYFDENLGPGSKYKLRGQETDMQDRLLKMNLKGVHVDDATVHHPVNKVVYSKNWVENRILNTSAYLAYKNKAEYSLLLSVIKSVYYIMILSIDRIFNSREKFFYKSRLLTYLGFIKGYTIRLIL